MNNTLLDKIGMTLTTKEEIDQVFKEGMDFLRKSWKEKEEKENNPPECSDTCEFKAIFLETPKEEFNVESDEPTDIIEEFLKESLHKIEIKEIKLQIESLEKEKEILEGRINVLYSRIFHSISDDVEFNNKVLTKLVGILNNNSLEELHEVYGNTKEE